MSASRRLGGTRGPWLAVAPLGLLAASCQLDWDSLDPRRGNGIGGGGTGGVASAGADAGVTPSGGGGVANPDSGTPQDGGIDGGLEQDARPAFAPYEASTVLDGILHRWTFDGDPWDSAMEEFSSMLGKPSFVAVEQRGMALSCDGINDEVSFENDLPATYSFSLWIQADTAGLAGNQPWLGSPLIWGDVAGANPKDFLVSLLGQRPWFHEGESMNSVSGTSDIADGKWHHLGVVREAGVEMTLYVDGLVQQSKPAGVEPPASNPIVRFCANAVDTRYYEGLVDEAHIYARALSTEEIRQLATFAGSTVVLPNVDGGAL